MTKLCYRCKKEPKHKKSSYCKECNAIISKEKYHNNSKYRQKQIDKSKRLFKKKYEDDEDFKKRTKEKNKIYRNTENFALSQINTYIKRLDKVHLEKAKKIIKDYMVRK